MSAKKIDECDDCGYTTDQTELRRRFKQDERYEVRTFAVYKKDLQEDHESGCLFRLLDENSMQCCGLAEISGLGYLISERDVEIVLESARKHRHGYVIASALVKKQKGKIDLLKSAGFTEIERFKNPNTNNQLVVLGRSTAKAASRKPKQAKPARKDRDRYDYDPNLDEMFLADD